MSKNANQRLGRGLSSLIPKKTTNLSGADSGVIKNTTYQEEVVIVHDHQRVLQIDPSKIDANPYQPRTEFIDKSLEDLAESIREHGIIQPLVVTKNNNRYELIAGERRLRAAKILGLTTVPAIVREENEQKKLELALIENIQREDLNPIETAQAYKQLIKEFNLTQEDLAQKVGKARASISNTMRLLNLPEIIQRALSDKKITEAHAKALLSVDEEVKQINLFKKILRHNLSVVETNQELKRSVKRVKINKNYIDKVKEDELSAYLNTKVELRRKHKGGKLIIDFYSDEDLTQIIKQIKP